MRSPKSLWLALASALASCFCFLALPPADGAVASEYEFHWGHPRPQGNGVFGIAFQDDATGWAVGGGGCVLRSDDGGVTWTLLHGPVGPASSLNDAAVLAGGALVAVGSGERIYRSTDGGVNFSAVPAPGSGELRDLAVFPGGLSAAGENGSVLVSTDGGLSWTERGPGVGTIRHHLWRSALEGYAVGVDVSHRTTNGGLSWTQITDMNGFGFNEVYFADNLHGVIVEDFGTWVSDDGGETWTEMFNPVPPLYRYRTLVLSPSHWITVTLIEGAELWETSDAGETWDERFVRPVAGIPCLTRLPGGRLIFGTDIGDLFRSDDLGQTVQNATVNLCEGAPSAPMTDLLLRPDGVAFAANQPNSGEMTQSWLRSDDGGLSWYVPEHTPGLRWINAKGFYDASRGVVTYNQYVRYTVDGGETWQATELAADRRTWDLALPAADRYYLATSRTGGGGDLMLSTDGGANWAPVAGGLPAAGSFAASTVDFVDAQTGYAAGQVGSQTRLYRTQNAGGFWQLILPAGLPAPPQDMHWLDAGTGLAAVQVFPSPGIYRSIDGGASWTSVTASSVHEFAFRDDSAGAAVSPFGETLLVTHDGGLSWTEEEIPFFGPAPGIQFASIDAVVPRADGWIVAGSNNRILVAIETLTGAPEPEEAEAGFVAGRCRLLGASPNPFNPATALRFELADAGPVRLTIHDSSGRRVRVLLRGDLAAGLHEASWDGRDDAGRTAAGGIYLARLVAGGGMDSMKLVLLK